MWQSLIRSDLEGIKQSSKALGVEEMYGLLACILTARSWDVITTGIDQGPVTDDEVCDAGKLFLSMRFPENSVRHSEYINDI